MGYLQSAFFLFTGSVAQRPGSLSAALYVDDVNTHIYTQEF